MTTLLNITTILSIGLMIGTELAVSLFVNPVIGKLDNRARLAALRLFAARLGFAMPFWYCLNLLLLIAETFRLRRDSRFPLVGAATAMWAAVIVLTLFFLVPINNRLARLSPDAPTRETLDQHQKWDSMHRLRIAALATAMILFLIGIHF